MEELMSNTPEMNTDEKIAELDGKLRAMHAAQENNSQNKNVFVTNYMEYADPQEQSSQVSEQQNSGGTDSEIPAEQNAQAENPAEAAAPEPKQAETPAENSEENPGEEIQELHEVIHNNFDENKEENGDSTPRQINFKKDIPEQETAEKVSIAEKTFQIFSKSGLFFLLLFTLILCGQQFLFPRDFWFSEEVRYADIYMNMLTDGNFLTLTLNGHPYAETGPLYFILVWLLDSILPISMPQAFFGASVLFAMLFSASTWVLARALGYSSKTAFASGLIALSVFFIAGFANYSRMDLLFVSFLNLSYACFYRAWQKKYAPFWLIFAFLFLSFASLTSTLAAFVLPFLASLLFFVWTGKLRRINSTDGIIGFLLALLIIFSWLACIYLQGDGEYLNLILRQQILDKLFPEFAYKTEPYWYYTAGLPFALFPWVFIILFAAWEKWLANSVKAFKARKENNASAWLIVIFIAHLGFFSLFKDKSFAYLTSIVPVFSVLCANTLLNLSELRSRLFFAFIAFLTVISGIFFILFEFQGYILEFLPNLWILPKEIPAFIDTATTNTHFGLTATGAVFIALGLLILYVVKRQYAGGTLLVYSFGVIVALQPLLYLVAPQLSTVFSTKNHAYEMAEANREFGAIPASYNIYPDVFTYYYNEGLNSEVYGQKTVTQIESVEKLTDFLLNNDTVILAISESDFEKLPYKNEAKVLDYKQWIENQYIILTLWQISANKPAAEPNERQEQIINNKILPNSENLLDDYDKNIIMEQPPEEENPADSNFVPEQPMTDQEQQDAAQTPQILPYLENDNPIPDNAVPAQQDAEAVL